MINDVDEAMNIRSARPEEAEQITALVMRSKAHWGYDDEFMALAVDDLRITQEYLEKNEGFVMGTDNEMWGFSSMVRQENEMLLDNLFIEPGFIGQGLGMKLWEHAVAFAREKGCEAIVLVSEPHAVEFYRKLGAVIIGEETSAVDENRKLPVMRFELYE